MIPVSPRNGEGNFFVINQRTAPASGAGLQESPARKPATRSRNVAILILISAIAAALWFAPFQLDPKAQHAIALTVFMILCWATEVMDHGLTGLVGCYLFWALGVVKFDVAFSGFADDTPWFLMGAILFGTIASKSGLARRIAYLVMARVGTDYSRLLLGLILSDFLLTLVVPSGMARVSIMAAVAVGLMEAFGLGPGSNVGRGMFLIITYTAGVFDKTIIAGAAAITGRGIIESAGHVEVLWSRWLLAFLPSDIITILVAWRIALWLYPPERVSLPGGLPYLQEELRKMGSWTLMEKKSLALLLVALALWATDFLHHISASMIGLGLGLLAVMPFTGILDIDDLKKFNYLQVIFVAAAVGMGKILTATKGLDVLTSFTFARLEPLLNYGPVSIFVLYWTGFLYHLFLASEISMLGTSMPLLMNFATAHNLDALRLGMIWVFSSGGKIFVYQSGVLIVGYAFGYFRPRDLFRLGLLMSLVDSLLLLVVVSVYWPLIGIR
jgi:anion transporter